jgi:hypothetical protein
MKGPIVVDLPTNRDVQINEHEHFPDLCAEIINKDARERFLEHASHFPYVAPPPPRPQGEASSVYCAWFADNGSWVYTHPAKKKGGDYEWCLFPYAMPWWVVFLRQALVRDIPSLRGAGRHGWNTCMITWERGRIASGDSTEGGFSWVSSESTVAMVIVGTPSPDAERGECTTLTLAPKIQEDGMKTIRRKCIPGTVLLLTGESSWTKWTYTFDSASTPYYRVCFFRVDPLTFPVHNKPYRGALVNRCVVIPALGAHKEEKEKIHAVAPLPPPPKVEEEEEEKEEKNNKKKNNTSKPRLPSTFKKRKADTK